MPNSFAMLKLEMRIKVAIRLSVVVTILFLVQFANTAAAQESKSLESLIKKALDSYPSVLSVQAVRDAEQTNLLAAKLKFLPAVTFNTQRNRVQFDGAPSSGQMPATNITLSQPLFLDGGVIAGYKKADARLGAADFLLLETRQDVSKRLVTVYVEWFKSWSKIQALEESVKIHDRLVGLVSRRSDQGVASRSDVELGLSRLEQVRAELESQRAQEQSSLTVMSELVGEQLTRQQLLGNLAKGVAIPKRVEGVNAAIVNSVSVQKKKFEADAAEQEAKEIRAQALPQLSMQAQRQIGNAIYPGAQGFNTVGLVVSYSTGGGLSSIASASAASDRARSATFDIETAKRDLINVINSEYNEYEFAVQKKQSLSHAAKLSVEIANSYDRQYLVGRKNWLDLMNAVREQVQTKFQLSETEGTIVATSRRISILVEGTQQFDDPVQ